MMLDLQRRGCHNVNVVTPTHYSAHIVRALDVAAGRGLRLPVVYNTVRLGAARGPEALDGVVDIYLPDFKYWDGKKAARYSSGAETIRGDPRGDPGDAPAGGRRHPPRRARVPRPHDPPPRDAERRGGDAERSLAWLAASLPKDTYVNVMSQYRPTCPVPPTSPRSPGRSPRRSTRRRSPAPAASA